MAERYNPKFNQTLPKNGSDNAECHYYVTRTVNTLEVAISQYLRPDEVQRLIDKGVDVTITPVK